MIARSEAAVYFIPCASVIACLSVAPSLNMKEPGAFTSPPEEDFRLRNMDDASGIEAHVLIEVAPEQPVNIDFYRLIPPAPPPPDRGPRMRGRRLRRD